MTMPDERLGTNTYAQNYTTSSPRPTPVPFYQGQTLVDGNTTIDNTFNGLMVWYNGSGAITLTFPATLMPGFNCIVVQGGAGAVTCAAGSGATMNNRQSFVKTAGQWAVMRVNHRSDGTFVLSGDGST